MTMVTAESVAQDIDRQCRSSFSDHLKWLVVSVFLLSGLARSTAQGQTLLTGGGATFPHPIYARWIAEFQKLHPDIEIEYNAIGSGAGIREITLMICEGV